MDIKRFFDHWNLSENPFQAEEANSDAVYARSMEGAVTHPDFQKIYGSPEHVSSSIVFGEKGSGKTAMRLLMERRLQAHNDTRSSGKVYVVRYDDLNPVLDRLAHQLSRRDPAKCLEKINLHHHQDAILSLAVTELIDSLLDPAGGRDQKARRRALRKMSREKRLDFALLALLYDQPRHGQRSERWGLLKSQLRFGRLLTRRGHGMMTLAFGLATAVAAGLWQFAGPLTWEWQLAGAASVAGLVLSGGSWLVRSGRKTFLGRRIQREIPSVEHEPRALNEALWDIPENEGTLHIVPDRNDQDKRYEATQRFLRVIESLGYESLIILVDRVDEPVMINSNSERMKNLVWPMLNNKFLQQERCGVKMLLPIELGQLLEKESKEFHQQARLDKQNLVNPLRWTGTTLYDLCSARFRSCQKDSGEAFEELKDLFEDDVEIRDLVDALDQMHQPRDAFKFLYSVILRHCQNTPGGDETYRIPRLTLDYVRQEQSQRVMNLYRGTQ